VRSSTVVRRSQSSSLLAHNLEQALELEQRFADRQVQSGLPITLVAVGSAAAFSVRHAGKHLQAFGELARKAPYVNYTVKALIDLLVGAQGIRSLLHWGMATNAIAHPPVFSNRSSTPFLFASTKPRNW
jgi:hypothetical protein